MFGAWDGDPGHCGAVLHKNRTARYPHVPAEACRTTGTVFEGTAHACSHAHRNQHSHSHPYPHPHQSQPCYQTNVSTGTPSPPDAGSPGAAASERKAGRSLGEGVRTRVAGHVGGGGVRGLSLDVLNWDDRTGGGGYGGWECGGEWGMLVTLSERLFFSVDKAPRWGETRLTQHVSLTSFTPDTTSRRTRN